MKTLIEKARKENSNWLVDELLQEFEEFASALTRLPLSKEESQSQVFIDKIGRSHERLQTYLARIAASFGMTVEQFIEFVGNPNNFAPSDWEEIQSTKKDLLEQLLERRNSKNKKVNKNVKI